MLHHARRRALGALTRVGTVRARVTDGGDGFRVVVPVRAGAHCSAPESVRRVSASLNNDRARLVRYINTGSSPLEDELEAQRSLDAQARARQEMFQDANAIEQGRAASEASSSGASGRGSNSPGSANADKSNQTPPTPKRAAFGSPIGTGVGGTRQGTSTSTVAHEKPVAKTTVVKAPTLGVAMFTDGATRTGPAGNRNLMPESPNDPNPGSSQKHLQEMLSNGSFEKYGVGGLDSEFLTIFRRVFASRMVDPEVVKKLGTHRALTNISQAHCSARIRPDCLLIHITKYTHTLKTEEIDRFISSHKGMRHVKGMLLYGPPGTGKTLVAKQLGRLLNAHPSKIVNGPEILQRFVGQSEENMRDLFAPAEKEFKGKGDKVRIYCISIIPPTGCQHSTDTDPFLVKKTKRVNCT